MRIKIYEEDNIRWGTTMNFASKQRKIPYARRKYNMSTEYIHSTSRQLKDRFENSKRNKPNTTRRDLQYTKYIQHI